MPTRLQLRRGTAASWTSTNPTLAQGEMGFETDTGKLKFGDGTTAWNSLAYYTPTHNHDATYVNETDHTKAAHDALDIDADTLDGHDTSYFSISSHDHTGVYEPSGAVSTHAGAADPHTGYQKESEKGSASGYAGLDAGSKVPTAQLGGAGADNTKYLRGDQTWVVPPGGGSADPPYAEMRAFVYKVSSTFYAKQWDGTAITNNANPATVINAAIDNVNSAGGGAVLLLASCGEMTVTASIVVKAHVSLWFEGSYGEQTDTGQPDMNGAVLKSGTASMVVIDVPYDSFGAFLVNPMVNGNRAGTRAATCVRSRVGMFQMFNPCLTAAQVGWEAGRRQSGDFVLSPKIWGGLLFDNDTNLVIGAGVTDGRLNGTEIKSHDNYGIDINAGGWQFHGVHFTAAAGATHIYDHRTGGGTDFACTWSNIYFDTASTHMLLANTYGSHVLTGCFFCGPSDQLSNNACIKATCSQLVLTLVGCRFMASGGNTYENLVKVSTPNGASVVITDSTYDADMLSSFPVADDSDNDLTGIYEPERGWNTTGLTPYTS